MSHDQSEGLQPESVAGSGSAPEVESDVVADRPTVAAPASPAPRTWWRRIRRASQATPPDVDIAAGDVREPSGPSSLLYRSPFQLGFFATLGGLVAIGVVAAVASLQSVLILAVLALYLALGLNPFVDWLHHRRVPRSIAVAIVAVLLVAVVGLGALAVLPVMTQQINALIQNTPEYLDDLMANQILAGLDADYDIIARVTEAVTSGAWIESLFGGLLGAGMVIANVLFSLIVVLVLTLYFLASLPTIKAAIYELAPASKRPRVRHLASEMFRRIGGYVVGLFAVVACAGTAAFVLLNIIGLGELSLALSVVVMGFAFIPLIGPTTSMLIVSIVAYSVSATHGIATLVFFVIYQQVDIYLLQPRIFARSVNVPGVVVVLAALCGGLLFGIAGALIAIPTAASLLLLYREVVVPELNRR